MRASLCTAAVVALGLLAAPVRAQEPELPATVRLLVPTCPRALPWAALSRAFEVELRTTGSALATDTPAELRVVLDLPCQGSPTEASVTLVHVESGRTVTDTVALGDARGLDRVRTIALALSELVRTRYGAVANAPEPPPPPAPPPPVVDVGRFEAEITRAADDAVRRAVPAPQPEPEPLPAPETLFDLGFGVDGYPAASNASAALRFGVSFRAPVVRLAVDLAMSGGWAAAPTGEIATGGAGLGLALRFAHDDASWAIASGLRVDVGWTRATGISSEPGVSTGALDALHIALLLDARLRLRLGRATWFVIAPEVGVALVGIDARADGRRITAQVGPRIGLSIGLSFGI